MVEVGILLLSLFFVLSTNSCAHVAITKIIMVYIFCACGECGMCGLHRDRSQGMYVCIQIIYYVYVAKRVRTLALASSPGHSQLSVAACNIVKLGVAWGRGYSSTIRTGKKQVNRVT